jgi:micrococcal nuclease
VETVVRHDKLVEGALATPLGLERHPEVQSPMEMIACLLAVLACLLATQAVAASCPRGTLTGEVTHVRDGDTIEVGGMPIRLQGLAAPESGEPGAGAATRAMTALVQGQTLRCDLDGERTHDRCVGICYLEGRDIAAERVRPGLARDCPVFSGGRYAALEQAAVAAGSAIWKAYRLPGYCR